MSSCTWRWMSWALAKILIPHYAQLTHPRRPWLTPSGPSCWLPQPQNGWPVSTCPNMRPGRIWKYDPLSKHIQTRFWIHCWTLADGTWFFTPISTVTSHTLRILLEFVMWMAYMVREAYRSTPKNALDILKHKSIAMKNHHVHCKSSTNGPFSSIFHDSFLFGSYRRLQS